MGGRQAAICSLLSAQADSREIEMRKRFAILAVAALASLVLLIPAGSAQAAYGSTKWCVGTTLSPGEQCGFWPLAVERLGSSWDVLSGGSGHVCFAILRWESGKPRQPLDDWGQPTNWQCGPLRASPGANWGLGIRNPVTGGFGAVYGVGAILNYSTATIRVTTNYNYLNYYG
jgi:hypothetical protein